MAKEPFAATLTCSWIGAAFFWIIGGFKSTYKFYLDETSSERNMWTGYALTIIILAIFIFIQFF
jgi:hypothetical protein